MKGLLYGVVALPFLAGIAWAQQPMQLTNKQMDRVTAGTFIEEISNTSATAVSIFQTPSLLESTPNAFTCSDCYLVINHVSAIDIGSRRRVSGSAIRKILGPARCCSDGGPWCCSRR
jgi:hypothetical protein